MLGKYVDWDRTTIELLQHHDENAVALANLRDEYAALSDGLGAIDYAKERVSATESPDDATVNRYIQKAAIEEKIMELVREARQYDRAWRALAEDERRILAEFFQRGRRPAQKAVDTLCDVYGYERTKIYELRRAALKKFKRLLMG